MKTKKPKVVFQVKRSVDGFDFWWIATHRNGNILFSSVETFTRKASAMKSMLNFIAAVTERDYEVK